jgi:hypothetical protein
MDPIYVPLFSALAGAIIGSASSITAIIIQSRIGDRRERIRQATSIAFEELKIQIANAKPGAPVYPISLYLHHHLAIINAIEENDLTPERLRKIALADEALMTATVAVEKELRERLRKSGVPG